MDTFVQIEANKYFPDLTDEQKAFSDLTLLQKYDAVLDVLDSESGKAPTFDDINRVLLTEKKKVHWGEVMDILYTMIGDKYLYGHFANQQGKQIFLLSFNGKLLKDTGGYEKKLEREKQKELLSNRQLTKSIEVSRWTKWNIGLALLMSATTLTVLLFTCNRDTYRYRKESERQKKDSLTQVQTQENTKGFKEELHQISLSLNDTTKVKVKIEK